MGFQVGSYCHTFVGSLVDDHSSISPGCSMTDLSRFKNCDFLIGMAFLQVVGGWQPGISAPDYGRIDFDIFFETWV